MQSFLDMCVDDDGSAICSAVYSGGALQLNLNSRFAAMYLTLEELESTVARDRLRPELVWRRLLSPECSGAYDEALCQAYFKGQNLGGEACEIVKVSWGGVRWGGLRGMEGKVLGGVVGGPFLQPYLTLPLVHTHIHTIQPSAWTDSGWRCPASCASASSRPPRGPSRPLSSSFCPCSSRGSSRTREGKGTEGKGNKRALNGGCRSRQRRSEAILWVARFAYTYINK